MTQAGAEGERKLGELLTTLGTVVLFTSADHGAAEALFRQSLELNTKYGSPRGTADALFSLGWVAAGRDQAEAAVSFYEESLQIFRQAGDIFGMGRVSQLLGELYLRQGEFGKARGFLEQNLRFDEMSHYKQGAAIALTDLGEVCRHQKDYASARDFYERSLLLCREAGLSWERDLALHDLGLVALHQDDYALARQCFVSEAVVDRMRRERVNAADYLMGFAAVAALSNRPEFAAKLRGAAQAIVDTSDVRISPVDGAEYERAIGIARDQAGEAAFEAWLAEGRAMTLDQAAGCALDFVRLAERSPFPP